MGTGSAELLDERLPITEQAPPSRPLKLVAAQGQKPPRDALRYAQKKIMNSIFSYWSTACFSISTLRLDIC